MDVREDTSLRNSHSCKELVKLLIVPNSQLEMSGYYSGLLVVPGSVAGQLENLSCQVLHNCCQVDRGPSTNAISKLSIPQMPMNSTNRELESRPG